MSFLFGKPASALSRSQDFLSFRSWVAQQKLVCDDKEWQYYDYGPKDVPPLVMLPAATTAQSFFKLFVSLSGRGYRLVAVQPPALWTHGEFVKGLDRFLDGIRADSVHLLGAGLGGYLALCYCQYRPTRVGSLLLCNAFIDTGHFYRPATVVSSFRWLPLFALQPILLSQLPTASLAPEVAESVDFIVEQMEKLSQSEVAARLTLACTENYIRAELLRLPSARATIVQALDDVSLPAAVAEEVAKLLPEAKVAQLKQGGPFPYLANAPELGLHILLHMRHHQPLPAADAAPPAPAPAPAPTANISS